MHTVVMVRHGESVWNRENRFTGWCDVPLTAHGEADAIDAGTLMGERGLKFDVAFTSNLERAWRTCELTLNAAGQSTETVRSSMLNERHYGALQGHLKDCPVLIDAFGIEKVLEWRRSYATAPPSLYNRVFADKIGPDMLRSGLSQLNNRYVDLARLDKTIGRVELQRTRRSTDQATRGTNFRNNYAPSTESLAQCEHRAFGYWREVIAPRVRAGERVLIVAHANTIRALVKAVDRIDEQKIAHLKIPNGIPLVYTMDEHLQPIDPTDIVSYPQDTGADAPNSCQATYLVSARNHSKMMQYESCVRKKMRSLFEFLDADGDGRITPDCLLHGLARLHSDNTVGGADIFRGDSHAAMAAAATRTDRGHQVVGDGPVEMGNGAVYTMDSQKDSRIQSAYCEFQIDELIRCVPEADEFGGITLQSFLRSEETLLPTLTHLKLLQ